MALVVLALPLLVSAYRNKDLIPEHPIIEVVTDSQSAKATAAQKPAARAPQAQGLAKRPIALMAVVIALEWSLVFWTALFLIDVAGISAAQGAVATAVLLTGVLAGRLAGSFLLERLGGWRLLVLSCALALIAVVLVLQAASMTSALLAAAAMLVWARPRSGNLESVS